MPKDKKQGSKGSGTEPPPGIDYDKAQKEIDEAMGLLKKLKKKKDDDTDPDDPDRN